MLVGLPVTEMRSTDFDPSLDEAFNKILSPGDISDARGFVINECCFENEDYVGADCSSSIGALRFEQAVPVSSAARLLRSNLTMTSRGLQSQKKEQYAS